LIRFVQQLQSTYAIAPQQTVIAGFSQGGILSASVALSSPASVAGFGILSGRILPELAPHIAHKDQLKPLRAFIGHGELDNKLPVAWAQRSEQILTDLGVSYTARRYPIGHEISAAMHADFVAWTNSITAGA
jgi:phospholipase/carboxylesterase